MSEEPKEFLELAEKAMEDYRKGKEVEMSVRALFNRLYYAAFYSAKAALMSIGEKPKTHRGTSHLVFKILHHEKNEIDRETASLLADLERLREEADYQVEFNETLDEVSQKASEVEDLIRKMKKIVEKET
jgi:uncharacterized protein (UPF0332 family)